ncbi:PAS domain S-box protein [Paenibacillus sp. CAA11]|uniref:bifunctional diguanylate cyclase/phosphodiesterase n=1 Tax=Paenibacillus sp. CAA11 TaxID=1532905 RepID=UPI000D395099|nr:bifunctional diguanylate cyclase/phosphodiesterase [Paenibacillus sp. CAA11]AWB43563.1 PAS domain S-box protein [Paenibacillus sp. CAA11]
MGEIYGTWNEFLITISFIISVAAAYSALDLAGRIGIARGRDRILWLITGAASMGIGIWAMHFVGMLAFTLDTKVSYDMDLVLLSVVLAIAVSAIAMLTIITTEHLGWVQYVAGGTLISSGIVGMHYTGMAAMTVKITYELPGVLLSVLIATVASVVAVWMLFRFRQDQEQHGMKYKLGGALIIGAAVFGMHYTGMAASHFHHRTNPELAPGMEIDPKVLAYFITAGTLLLIGLTLFGIFVNRRLTLKDSALEAHDRWYRSLYENNQDGILSVDTDGRIIGLNPALSRLSGYQAERYLYKHISSLGVKVDPQFLINLSKVEIKVPSENGELELSITSVPVSIEGKNVGTHLLIRDISEEKKIKDQVQHLAYHDELTGLPNRRRFNQVLSETILNSRVFGARFAVMMIDIDRFKMINDSLGHAYGDIFLRTVSERIREAVKGYQVTLARMGGDEFTLIFDGWNVEEEVELLAERIISSIQVPYHLKDNDFYITASIGIAIYPGHGSDEMQLLRNCDSAMYEVKKQGKNGYRFYSSTMDNKMLEKIALEAELRKAVERGELVIHYQPQIRMPDQTLAGIEALVRWNHRTRGMIPPGVFIPIAEETGVIYELGNWVMREACRQMSVWQRAGRPAVPVSVNLSSQQFHQPGLMDNIREILSETGLAPEYLELEITESMMMDASMSIDILQALTELGVRISLDDFGTGYSSLSYLKLFPIQRLKIDRSFITHITSNESDKAIVAAIISMARHLKMNVVAEGIETREQLDILVQSEGVEIQGYYFSKPITAEELEKSYLSVVTA